jgi:hypothetical protein
MRLQLACTSIRHFKLNHRITKGFEISLLESRVWPLRTLHLELTCDLWKKETIAVLYASILRLCAPSLETLVWIPVGPVPQFPCLRNLHLQMLEFADSSIMDAFLRSKLVKLKLIEGTNLLDEALDSCGQIPSLKALSMTKPTLVFLQANTQLSKIDFDSATFSRMSLETQILPILSTLSNLTSLRIS